MDRTDPVVVAIESDDQFGAVVVVVDHLGERIGLGAHLVGDTAI